MGHFDGCTFKPEPPSGTDLSRERILLHCCCAPCSTAILEWMVDEGLRPGLFFSNSNIVPFDEYEKRRLELVRFASAHGLAVFDDEYDHPAWLGFVRSLSLVEGQSFDVAQEPPIDLAAIPERGPRCLACFKFRLLRAALFARSCGYTLLTTTLASSRWKDLNQVNQAGLWAVEHASSGSGGIGVWDASLRSAPPPSPKSSSEQVRFPSSPSAVPPLTVPRVACSQTPIPPEPSNEVPTLRWWGQNWRKGGLQNRRSELIRSCNLYNQSWCGCEFSKR